MSPRYAVKVTNDTAWEKGKEEKRKSEKVKKRKNGAEKGGGTLIADREGSARLITLMQLIRFGDLQTTY